MAPTVNQTQPTSVVTWDGLLLLTNASTSSYDDSTAAPVAQELHLAYLGLTAIVILALVTNILIIFVVRRQAKLHTVFYHLLASLAVVHLISAVSIMPLAITKAVMGEWTHWSIMYIPQNIYMYVYIDGL